MMMKPANLKKVPAKMVLPKPTVKELQQILDGDGEDHQFTSGPGGEMIEVVNLTDLRANIGGWMDNVAAGRKLAVARKGEILAILLPPPTSKPRRLTSEELEKKLLEEDTDGRTD